MRKRILSLLLALTLALSAGVFGVIPALAADSCVSVKADAVTTGEVVAGSLLEIKLADVFEDTDGHTLTYTLTNRGDVAFPCLWAAHCMLRGQDDLRIRTPFPADAPVDYMFGATPADALPLDRLTGYAPGTGAAYKYYYTQPTPAGWLTGMYTASGHSFTLDYRADSASAAVPYVGIWINNGAFRDYYNIALECCTAPYDAPDKAEAHGYPASLPPHASRRFTLRVRVE